MCIVLSEVLYDVGRPGVSGVGCPGVRHDVPSALCLLRRLPGEGYSRIIKDCVRTSTLCLCFGLQGLLPPGRLRGCAEVLRPLRRQPAFGVRHL